MSGLRFHQRVRDRRRPSRTGSIQWREWICLGYFDIQWDDGELEHMCHDSMLEAEE
jgi:hypothetical protein